MKKDELIRENEALVEQINEITRENNELKKEIKEIKNIRLQIEGNEAEIMQEAVKDMEKHELISKIIGILMNILWTLVLAILVSNLILTIQLQKEVRKQENCVTINGTYYCSIEGQND